MSTLQVTKYAENNHDSILVLLHGWGSSSKIWESLIGKLSEKFEVWCIDLPGHGNNQLLDWDGSVEQGLQLLEDVLPPACSIIGWSLGGLYAQLFLQRCSKQVKNIMLISSSPKFVASKNWPNGMPLEKFRNFCNHFATSPQETLQQFFALQILHGSEAKKLKRILSAAAVKSDFHKIAWGLEWLENVDLRKMQLAKQQSIQYLHGENDQVISTQSVIDAVNLWPGVQLGKVSKAAHVPFLSHPEILFEHLEEWR